MESYFPSLCSCHLENTTVLNIFLTPPEYWLLPHLFPPPWWTFYWADYLQTGLPALHPNFLNGGNHILIPSGTPMPCTTSWFTRFLITTRSYQQIFNSYHLPLLASGYQWETKGTWSPTHGTYNGWGTEQTINKSNTNCVACWRANHHFAVIKRVIKKVRQAGHRTHRCKSPDE